MEEINKKQNSPESNTNKVYNILLAVFIAAMIVWIVGQNTNVYEYALVGAIYEIVWLPTILVTFLMPVAIIYFWYRDQFKWNSKFRSLLFIFILSVASIYAFMGL